MLPFSFKMIHFSVKMLHFSFKMLHFSFKMLHFSFKMLNFSSKMYDFSFKVFHFSFKMVIRKLKMAFLNFQKVPGQDLAENGPLPFVPHEEWNQKNTALILENEAASATEEEENREGKQHERRRNEGRENVTNDMGTTGGWGEAAKYSQTKKEYLCQTER